MLDWKYLFERADSIEPWYLLTPPCFAEMVDVLQGRGGGDATLMRR
jgi:hypothetical protein